MSFCVMAIKFFFFFTYYRVISWSKNISGKCRLLFLEKYGFHYMRRYRLSIIVVIYMLHSQFYITFWNIVTTYIFFSTFTIKISLIFGFCKQNNSYNYTTYQYFFLFLCKNCRFETCLCFTHSRCFFFCISCFITFQLISLFAFNCIVFISWIKYSFWFYLAWIESINSFVIFFLFLRYLFFFFYSWVVFF